PTPSVVSPLSLHDALPIYLLGLVVVLWLEQVGRVEEGGLFQADVDERGLDARKNCLYPAEVDVTDDSLVIGSIDQQLHEPVVLEDRHPRLALGTGDENFALHGSLDRAAARIGAPRKSGRKVTAAPWPGSADDAGFH